MSDKSKIEWTDATWNPVTGCTKVSAGCKFCYAEREFRRVYAGRPFTSIKLHPERLELPLRWKKPRKVFVNSLSDLFHDQVPDEFIDKILAVMTLTDHIFQVLTKRPQRMKAYFSSLPRVAYRVGHQAGNLLLKKMFKVEPGSGVGIERSRPITFPISNLWLGVSVEDQATADERIPPLLQTPAAVRWVSYEPALGPVKLGDSWLGIRNLTDSRVPIPESRLFWVVAGGESGPKARPAHPDWFRSVRDQCQAAGVPFFFKQWGEWAPFWISGSYRRPQIRLTRQGRDGSDLANSSDGGDFWMHRLGKKRAGRLLDGREWNEFPKL